MKISVMITTYNLEKYIAVALESVLSQETEYEYEILVSLYIFLNINALA